MTVITAVLLSISIDRVANLLLGRLPKPEKEDVVGFIEEAIKQRSKS